MPNKKWLNEAIEDAEAALRASELPIAAVPAENRARLQEFSLVFLVGDH